ncbi:hypothetical protein AV521_08900 [Streptomyces sp. IMTB 2501]|uniref:hypothetical protein n=1 Tax=Streptomyces sp. IMTB 2501 TaxID=1776340 RepID=UPI00096E8394|nr:hypothetical protein [Streptomyces sp. IMTB 2501]OLZ72038.1 hypothetical protein AV521_08900 [Streptomyces sp. IMTB 2501]
MPDHFDRLVGRAVPAAAPVGGTDGAADAGVVRVRPRLPGPFERMDAFGARIEPFGQDFEERVSAESTRRTEPSGLHHRPVETAPRRDVMPVQAGLQRRPLALLEQTAPQRGVLMPAAVPQPATEPAARPAGRTSGEGERDDTTRRPRAVGQQATKLTVRREPSEARREAAARPAVVPAQTARPVARPAGPAGGRQSARDNARQRPQERTVHISIGRLEVRAAGRRNDADARPRERAPQSGRQSPVLSLEKYLSRGEAQR